jgi:hypothetical protein
VKIGDLVQWKRDHNSVGVVIDTCIETPNVVEIYWLSGKMIQFNMQKALSIISQAKKKEEKNARDL